jgi:hypothetical protein
VKLVRFLPLSANPQFGCKVQPHPQYLSPVLNPDYPGQRPAPEQEAVMSANGALGTRQKALALNLDATTYGTLAEIGGGQEVARWFFSAGGAAGTVAKTVSAYDMAVSDAHYGPARRYVSRQRLEAMLDHEFASLRDLLGSARGDAKRFFAFADTVATGGHKNPGPGRGWLGVRFQARPHEEPSEVVHAHLLDPTPTGQQEALGVLGVNLLHAAFFRREDPADLVAALMDDLSRARVEVDMIRVSGPAFAGVDNRLLTLELVEQGLTDAALFTAAGEVVQPSEVLRKRPVLVERCTFRPVTRLTVDLLDRALEQFLEVPGVREGRPVVLAEMTLRDLGPEHEVGHPDFLARADILGALGYDVLVSRFDAFHELAEYLARSTDAPVGIAVVQPALGGLMDEAYHAALPGGALESIGRLFKRSVTVYAYPDRDPDTGEVRTAADVPVAAPWGHLRDLLLELGRVVPVRGYDESLLSISTHDVLARLRRGDPSWEEMVPAAVAATIKAGGLFGWRPARALAAVA